MAMSRLDRATIMSITNYEIKFVDDYHFSIQSMSNKSRKYIITVNNDAVAVSCSCPDYQFRSHKIDQCKHQIYFNKSVNPFS